jgi:sarcosine oxidase subunit alpha
MIVEAMPKIGAYFVHAAKVRRMGVPILTRHSILRAYGDGQVEGATIVQLDDSWQPIPGTEKDVEVDGIAISVGLRPTYGLLDQAGVKIQFVPELGGHVALRNKNLETSVKNIYIAGDIAGIEEASTAIMEGRIAGLSAVIDIGMAGEDAVDLREKVREELRELRAGPFG